MRRNVRLALAFGLVAAISAVLGAIYLAPLLSGTQITIGPVPTTLALQPTLVPGSEPTGAPPIPTASATPVAAPTLTTPVESTSTIQATPAVLTPTSDPDAPVAERLLLLLNAERQAAQCDVALATEPRLSQAAQEHAEDMARNSRIDHIGSDGATYAERLDRVGYAYNRRGENIAAGFATPPEVLAIWMDEPADGPHRVNILNCAYRHAGIGLALRADDYQYWVLDLAEPK